MQLDLFDRDPDIGDVADDIGHQFDQDIVAQQRGAVSVALSLGSRDDGNHPLATFIDRLRLPSEIVPRPSTAEARFVYRYLRDCLEQEVLGQNIGRLALIGAGHALGGFGARVCLCGPSGSGKTTATRALSRALGLPYVHISVPDLAETNFKGVQLADVIGDLWRAAQGNPFLAQRSVISLDEIDKIAVRNADGGAGGTAGDDYRRGKQHSLLALLGLEEMRVNVGVDDTRVWSSREALMISAGVFGNLSRKATPPTQKDLQRFGFMPELSERLGTILQFRPTGGALPQILRANLKTMTEQFTAFGYALEIPQPTIEYVAARVRDGSAGRAGTRAAITMLNTAAQTRLLSLLDEGAEVGSRTILAPDDVDVPS